MTLQKPGFWGWAVASVVIPTLRVLTKRDYRGWEHVPAGGVIVVSNHVSHADPPVVAVSVYDSGRWPRILAKESLFKLPIVGPILSRIEMIPVRRGSIDASKALDAAVTAIREGGIVVVYPEGTTTREPDLWPMRGKTGAARLALLTGAPVVPVAVWGPEQMFDPRTKKFRLRLRTPVSVWAGPAVDLEKWRDAEPTTAVLNEMTEVIMLRVRDLLAEIRGTTPPPLWSPAAARKESSR